MKPAKEIKLIPASKLNISLASIACLDVFEQKLTNEAYLLNGVFSAVDVAAISGLGYYSLRFGNDWQQEYPQLSQWFKLLHQRQSIQSTIPQA